MTTAPRSGLPGWARKLIGYGIFVAIAAGFGIYASYTNAKDAAVGECLQGQSGKADSYKRADCTKPEASFKVAGIVEDQSEFTVQLGLSNVCEPFPTAKSVYWEGKKGGKGRVLCLEPVTH
ncbi:LppU/SCO3897 family protein [Crossiella cryophila]|uniref:Uncharacterized protein n=1 Tax=Crossiella cryophila TaxID=43355 RepID=A0A7W7CLL0_9PSEU|nr:hypothetical protein [Crossiella cryophila]MBB4682066.1 hypothetical protein [Crossiella cryophila]